MRALDDQRLVVIGAVLALFAVGCGSNAPTHDNAEGGPPTTEPTDAGASDAGESSQDASSPDAGFGPGLLVGYYAEWKKSSFPASAIQWGTLTHLAEAFFLPEVDGGIANAGTLADDALVAAAHANGVKIIASVGGATGDFSASVVAPGPRARTVAALALLCAEHGYDGVDIDWEFPDTGSISAWVSLLDELRTALDAVRPGLTLSSTIGPTPPNSDLPPLASLNKLDWVEIMAYRYSDPSSDEVGFISPLDVPPDAGEGSVSETVHHLVVDRGVPASKLLLGLPFYGFEFEDGPPGTPVSSPSKVLELDDSSVLQMVGAPGWTLSWDTVANAPSLTNGKLFLTYEDTQSIDTKCAFAHQSGLGGAMVWHMAQGVLADGAQPLLEHAANCR